MIDLNKIKAAAQAATPGPWVHGATPGGWDAVYEVGYKGNSASICKLSLNNPENAVFIAAANPAAPWTDFDDKPIYEGDTIRHPGGEEGIVIFLAVDTEPSDQWRVDYGDGSLCRLCLQIGEKGMAVVIPATPSKEG